MVNSEYVPIKTETLKGFADAVRLACDIDGELYPEQMTEHLNNLPTAKINGLPKAEEGMF